MPTNQEWLHKLANESPDELKAWFDAEHNDDLAAEKVVSGDDAHSNDANAHLKASEDLSDGFTDSREKLEADMKETIDFWGAAYPDARVRIALGWLDRQAAITRLECAEEHRARLSEMHDLLDEAASERELLRAELTEYKHSHPDAPNKPISQSDARKSAKTAETDAAKDDICDFGDASSMGDGVEQDNNRTCPISNGTRPNTCNKSGENVTDSREKLEADVRSSLGFTTKDVFEWLDRQAAITEREYMERSGISELQGRVDELREAFDEVCKSANVPTDWKPIFSAGAVTGTIEGTQKLLKELTAERDNLAADLLACNREREQLRKHLGIALDHAHDICSLVDIDGNVLDVGD